MEQPYLNPKIHNDDTTFTFLLFACSWILFHLGALVWNLEHGLLVPPILFFASANLFDDPGIEHSSIRVTYNTL